MQADGKEPAKKKPKLPNPKPKALSRNYMNAGESCRSSHLKQMFRILARRNKALKKNNNLKTLTYTPKPSGARVSIPKFWSEMACALRNPAGEHRGLVQFKEQGVGCRVYGFRAWVWGFGFEVLGYGYRV